MSLWRAAPPVPGYKIFTQHLEDPTEESIQAAAADVSPDELLSYVNLQPAAFGTSFSILYVMQACHVGLALHSK